MNRPPSAASREASALPISPVEDLAADWLARREVGLSVDEQAEFSRWLLADPRHAAAVERLEATWRFLQKPRFTGQAGEVACAVEERVALRARRIRRRWRVAGLAGALAAAAALVIAYLPSQPQPLPTAPGRAAVSVAVKPERRALADGSSVELNAGAEIEVAFSAESRAVRLMRGEALFAVAKDPLRPFVVTAGGVVVRAVGTEFAVRLAVDEVGVLVTEGRVAVEPAAVTGAAAIDPAKPAADTVPAAAPVVYVDAGNRLTVPVAAPAATLPRPSPVSATEAQAALAWRGMRIEFTNTPLAEVVALFNRHNRTELAVGTADVGEIRISGIFWADDPEGLARLLEASAGLRADHSSAGRIVFRR